MKDLSNENIIHAKKDGIEYIQFKRLLEYQDKIVHAYTIIPSCVQVAFVTDFA